MNQVNDSSIGGGVGVALCACLQDVLSKSRPWQAGQNGKPPAWGLKFIRVIRIVIVVELLARGRALANITWLQG